LDRAADAVRDRPDLVVQIRLAAADRLREDKRNKEAAEALLDLLRKQSSSISPACAWAVMSRLDELLRLGDGDLPRLRDLYAAVFAAMPRPAASKYFRTTPYYRVGWNYAQVLEELKDAQRAQALRTTLANLVIP
jgi:hypothetical protein